MSSRSNRREKLIDSLNDEGRQFSTATVILHQAIAAKLGLSAGDHKYVDILLRNGPMTAGRLAELTGLTTGAITGIIDRLEKAGWVKRAKDAADRRRVIVQPTMKPSQERRAGRLFGPLAASMAELVSAYKDEEIELILDFLGRTRAMLQNRALSLRSHRK
jgi:DNA-binding MarR family transcriptional regulator